MWHNKTTSLIYTSKNIRFKDNQVVSLKPIIRFKNVTHLELDFMNLSSFNVRVDMKFLSSMTKIRSLNFNGIIRLTNHILTPLTNLDTLRSRSKFVAIKSLEYLTKLSTLDIILDCNMNYTSISKLTNLTNLSIDGDIDFTIVTSRLHDLCLRRCRIADDALKKFTNLTRLTILECFNFSDSIVEKITYITHLRLASVGFTSRSLKKLTNLVSLDIYDCPNIKNNAFRRMQRLQYLSIAGKPNITSDCFLHLTNLTELYVCESDRLNHRDLRNLTNLTDLYLYDCKNSQIKYGDLKKLTNLTNIFLEDAKHLSTKKLRRYLPKLKNIELD